MSTSAPPAVTGAQTDAADGALGVSANAASAARAAAAARSDFDERPD